MNLSRGDGRASMNLQKMILLGLVALLTMSDSATAADKNDACARIAGKLSSVSFSECLKRNLLLTGAVSVRGEPILIEEYPPLPSRTPQARVLLIGGIHGDELSSVSVVFKWMEILAQHHSGLFHWRVAPLVNPDGLLQSESQRVNANGVDLNRNFPTPDWQPTAQDYWIMTTGRNPRRYPGMAPASEPESRWLVEEIERFHPDVIVSVHAPFGLLDFDGTQSPPTHLGSLYLNQLGTYPGSLGNYGLQHSIPVVTIELPAAGRMPSDAETRTIWTDLVRWLRVNAGGRSVQGDQTEDQAGPS